MDSNKEIFPQCGGVKISFVVYGKTNKRSVQDPNKTTCFEGCLIFPDENNIIPDRKYTLCGYEWHSTYENIISKI